MFTLKKTMYKKPEWLISHNEELFFIRGSAISWKMLYLHSTTSILKKINFNFDWVKLSLKLLVSFAKHYYALPSEDGKRWYMFGSLA